MQIKKIIKNILKKLIYKPFFIMDSLYWEYKYDLYRQKYNIDKNFRFNGKGILFYGEGDIICGENSYIGEYSSIQVQKGYKVIIGKNCRISHFVQIYTHTAIADQDFSNYDKLESYCADVIIEDSCWIGAKVFINPGVKIGQNSVIGANAVVTRNIPPHTIAVGVPAKVIKFKSYLSEEEIKKL